MQPNHCPFRNFNCIFIPLILLGNVLTTQAGLFGEHKQIGDAAFQKFLSGDTAKINFFRALSGSGKDPYNNVVAVLNPSDLSYPRITYGDLTGLSGDHSIQPVHLFYQLLQYDPNRYFNGLPQHAKLNEASLMNVLMLHHKAIREGKKAAGDISLMLAQNNYVALASEDLSHFFVLGKKNIEEHLNDAVSKYISGTKKINTLEYLKYHLVQARLHGNKIEIAINQGLLDSLFTNWFMANSISKYCILHSLALDMVDEGTAVLKKSKYVQNDDTRLLFNLALLFNACADHYLQDAFAAGHLAEVRTSTHAPKDKGIHDYYNRVGLSVKNARGDAWTSRGDGFINAGDVNDGMAIEANVNSLQDLWLRYQEDKASPEKRSLTDALKILVADSTIGYFKNHFTALHLIPIPVHKDSILFARSKMGHFFSLDFKEQGPLFSKAPVIGLHYGIGYVMVKPSSTTVKGRESNFWLGLFNTGLGYGAGSNIGQISLSLMECMFYDKLSLNVLNGGYQYNFREAENSGWYWNPALGIELKRITWKIAPSIKFGIQVTKALTTPALSFELRHY